MNIHDSEAKFKHITEMTILTVQLTVEFSKKSPGFDTLLREDQITLLKVDFDIQQFHSFNYNNNSSIIQHNHFPFIHHAVNFVLFLSF